MLAFPSPFPHLTPFVYSNWLYIDLHCILPRPHKRTDKGRFPFEQQFVVHRSYCVAITLQGYINLQKHVTCVINYNTATRSEPRKFDIACWVSLYGAPQRSRWIPLSIVFHTISMAFDWLEVRTEGRMVLDRWYFGMLGSNPVRDTHSRVYVCVLWRPGKDKTVKSSLHFFFKLSTTPWRRTGGM
jgi:hypothetical protein